MTDLTSPLHTNDRVLKVGEDSMFEGVIVSVFTKRNGRTIRYIIENDDGVLHIASQKQLKWIASINPLRG